VNGVLLAWRWLAMPGLHFAVANDLDQSQSRQFLEIADMCKRNPYLRQNVDITRSVLTFRPTGSILQALSGDATGNAGANFLTVSHTEAWGILYEQDRRNWEELTQPPGLFYGLPALRIADSYAGHLDESNTWHDLVDRGIKGEPVSDEWPLLQVGGLMLFHMIGNEAQKRCFRGTPELAGTYYSEQRQSLRENAYRRLHLNERTSSAGTFIEQEAWEALIDPSHRQLQPGSTIPVYLGLDLALAEGGDNCALVGTYGEGGQVKVAFHKVWQGGKFRVRKLSIENNILPYILGLKAKYNIRGVYYDPWQSALLAENLQSAGLTTYEVRQTHQSRGPKDTRLFEMASNGELVLYDHPELKLAAANASAKELPDGKLFLTKGGRGKIDLLVALSNCADAASDYGRGSGEIETSEINPFYNDLGDDFDIKTDLARIGNRYHYMPGHNQRPHAPGVTWQNCRHRNKGCAACIAEMESQHIYQADKELDAARAANAQNRQEDMIQDAILEYQQAARVGAAKKQVIQNFWTRVRQEMMRDD
jgi:hypothetical protein